MAGILQDSVSDWAHEASQMANIFSNSYLTIAASAAENGHQGLLNRRRTTRIFDVVHGDKAFAVYVRDNITHEFQARESEELPFNSRTKLPLRQRAWCLQEELLSTRIVHFTGDEMIFVCRAATTCECDPRWNPRFQIPPIIGTSSYRPSEIWNNLVWHYTERQISFHKDRLPALSSLTYVYEKDSGRYFAGLWESHMPGSLLWWTQDGQRPEQERETQSRPPSWSWASIEGVVSHFHNLEGHKDVTQVLDVCTYPNTVDPRGMVSGGQITLRAPLFPLGGTWKSYENSRSSFLSCYTGSISADSCFASSPGWAPNLPWNEDECYCVLDDPTKPLLLLPNGIIDTTVFLLVIFTLGSYYPSNAGSRHTGYRFLGLLVQPLDDLDQTQAKTMEDSESKLSFVRIGVGGMYLGKEHGDEALQRFGNTIVTIF